MEMFNKTKEEELASFATYIAKNTAHEQ